MSPKVSLLWFIFNFGYLLGCIPTESPEDRPDIPGAFTTTIATTSGAIATTSTAEPTTTSLTTTTSSTTTTSTTTTTTTTTTTSTTTTTTYFCPAGWLIFTVPTGETYCYYISLVKRNYEDSEADCMSMFTGAHLASVHSEEENDFIYTNLILPIGTPNGANLYTEMTRIGGMSPPCTCCFNPGPFVYEDGTDFDYSNWCGGPPFGPGFQEPNCYFPERCVQIMTPNSGYYLAVAEWDNIGCERVTRYVCKAPPMFSG